MIRLIAAGAAIFLVYLLEQLFYRRLWSRGLGVRIQFKQDSLFEGEEGVLLETVENQSRLPLPVIQVKFQTSRSLIFASGKGSRSTDQYYRNDVFQIGGGERVTRSLVFSAGKRGFYRINSCDLVASDLFLTAHMMKTLPVQTSVLVYPNPWDSQEFRLSLQQINGEMLARRHLLEDPFEYRGIRDYQPSDDMRSINWKATAKTGELKINQKNCTSLKAVRIFLNLEDNGILKKEECVEACLRVAAGLCEYFLGQGMQVSCCGNSRDCITGEPLSLEAGAGAGQMTAVYKSLARTDAGDVLPFVPLWQNRLSDCAEGSFTFLVTPCHYDAFTELIRQFDRAGNDFVWFYPVCGTTDPKLPSDIEKHIRFLHIQGNA